MTPQSHAQQMLLSLYRKVLRRGSGSRPRMEPLPPRVLWSVTPAGSEAFDGVAATAAAPLMFASSSVPDDGEETADNAPPVNLVPPAQVTLEDIPLIFSTANGNAISIDDPDAGMNPVQVTLSASSGSLTLATTTGLTFGTGDGTADASMSFTGAIAAINNALDGLSFSKPANVAGTATLTITTNDLGNTGAGGALSDTDTVAITLIAVNDAPSLSLPPTQSIAEDSLLKFASLAGNAISVSDVDANDQLVQMSLSVTSGTLTLASLAGLTFTAGDGAADQTIVFKGMLPAVNIALEGMSFMPPANFNGAVTLSATINDLGSSGDGGPLSASGSVTINVAAVNDAPINILPPPQSVSGGGLLNLGTSSGAVLAVSDIDAGSGQLEVTLEASAGTMTLATISGLTFSNGDGNDDGSMTFRGTLAAINAALDGMSYHPPLILPGNAHIDITTNDLGNSGAGGDRSDSDRLIVAGIVPPNAPPAITAPSSQATAEDGPLVFSNSTSNAVVIADADAGAGELEVTLVATNGTFTFANTAGLTFITGDGASDTTITFRATLAAANAALNGLVFTPADQFSGSATLSIDVNDQGNSGAGGPQVANAAVNINVTPVNDAPVNNIPAPQFINEDQSVIFSTANGNLISVHDIDVGAAAMELMLTAVNGVITLAGTSGLTFITGDGTADAAMKFTGTLASINAALDGLAFTPNANFNGIATLHMRSSDLGNTGAGGTLVDDNHVNIVVAAVNDAPINNVPGLTPNMSEDGAISFSGGSISITDVDAGAGQLMVALSSLNGTMTLSRITGLTFQIGDGVNDASMVFTGTLANINAALNDLTFRPDANFNGIASIAIVTDDQGNSGAGGAMSDNEGFAINVLPINDAPAMNLPGNQVISYLQALTFSAVDQNAITVGDVDAGTSPLLCWLSSAGSSV